jgi:hypothetical protein
MHKTTENKRRKSKIITKKQEVKKTTAPRESGGPKAPEPTRYGDWERKGRCIDF